ncbi:MAG: polysulfide reductase NrfD [Hyphomicrobiales bacterium]|nr:polysulfide reductase NrfD [Hyphomicrobiales bacterium]
MTGINVKYERLIGDLRRDFRPQREWGEGRGVFLVIGHFLVGIAAGAWLFGLVFEYLPGLLAGYLLAAAGGVAHLAFLGRPERFWRMARQVRTAWVARGFWGLVLFIVGASLYLPPLALAAWPWGAAAPIAWLGWLLAAVGMVVLMSYMGFVYTASKGIPFWNSALHPVLYIAYALRGGAAALLFAMALLGAPSEDTLARLITIWIAVTATVVVLFAIELQGAWTGGNAAARRSAQEMLSGRVAIYFYGGTLLLGLLVPLALVSGRLAPLSLAVLAAVGLLSALGDFFMKYTTIRAGIYQPLRAPVARSR